MANGTGKPRSVRGAPTATRIKDATDRSGDCWLWLGNRNEKGYGLLKIGGTTKLAHRVSYECFVGPIPEGLQIDHLCRVRHCVNPLHLEAVTSRENTMRGTSFAARNARKTHCKFGHEFTPENTYWSRGHRWCRACRRRWRAERQLAVGGA